MVGQYDIEGSLTVTPFRWAHWASLWQLRFVHLAELGIVPDPQEIPRKPEDVEMDDHEWDFHHIGEVYLSRAGGFWLASWGDTPVGHVGAQDLVASSSSGTCMSERSTGVEISAPALCAH